VPNDEMKDDLRTQWQSQPREGGTMSLEEIRTQAVHFQKRLRNRNIREYSAMVLGIAMTIPLAVFLRSFPLVPVAMGLCIAGTLVIAYQFRKRMATRSFTAAAASVSCREFYLRELERQRDANLSIGSWYILPMIPGAAMLCIALSQMPGFGSRVGLIYGVLFTIAFVVVAKLNKRKARQLQEKIDELHQ